ncbi:efflux pump, RND family, outer membrane protein [Geotalea daltonii FRC-32]|uniref:Efflux pump, RND family, outer membrane protein n=1 Tax=Geotalea daltonii (strain DSM 22248 / JCM 15807 / FRC-32) TaxID=316067 RepID=B9M1S2_GEODF|nr:TolC family protein [Geotalea daltonii]ACM19218.1 efflux pump, RND family, outer membrane protein [Geotalea daltonii FRC-32]
MGTTVFGKGAWLFVPGILCFLTSAPVFAETQKLALPQVIEISLQNNGDLKSFREEKGIRDAGKNRAGLLPNPTLELNGGTGALTGSSAENSLSLGISQEFLLAGKRHKRLVIAEQELAAYRWQLADRERALREEVKMAFYDAILAEQRLNLTDRSIALNRQLLDVTKERLAAGDIPELEMNLVKVELTRSEGTRIEVERALLQNRARLFTLMGLPAIESPAIAGNLDNDLPTAKSLVDLKQLALVKRPDLKVLEAEKSKGEADIALAKSEAIPNLTAGFTVTREATTIEVGGVEGKDTDYIVGVKLSIPIPVFDKNQAGIQEARAKRSTTDSRFTAATRRAEREVETAHASYLNADKILSLYKSNIIPQLEENLKLTQEAYRLGEVGILAVIQEQKKFFESNEAYLTALHSRQLALTKLEAAVGVSFD